MNYFAAHLVQQFKARGTYPSVLPTFPAPGLDLQQELKGKGWVGVRVGEEATETQQRTGAVA